MSTIEIQHEHGFRLMHQVCDSLEICQCGLAARDHDPLTLRTHVELHRIKASWR
jgi:hypothetical protein